MFEPALTTPGALIRIEVFYITSEPKNSPRYRQYQDIDSEENLKRIYKNSLKKEQQYPQQNERHAHDGALVALQPLQAHPPQSV